MKIDELRTMIERYGPKRALVAQLAALEKDAAILADVLTNPRVGDVVQSTHYDWEFTAKGEWRSQAWANPQTPEKFRESCATCPIVFVASRGPETPVLPIPPAEKV